MRCMSRASERSSRAAARMRLTVGARSCREDSLGDVAGRSRGARQRDLFVSAGRHQHDGDEGKIAFDGRHECQAVHLRHDEVGDDEIGDVRLEAVDRLLAVFG